LLGRGAENGEPLQHIAELLLEPVALGGELASFGCVQLALLGDATLVLGGRVARLATRRLKALQLLPGTGLLVAKLTELLLARGLRFSKDVLEPVDVAEQPVALVRGIGLRLGKGGFELLDRDLQLVPLFGGRGESGEA